MSSSENREYAQYDEEVKSRYGDTDAYRESRKRTAGYYEEKWNAVGEGMNDIFAEFSACMEGGHSADSEMAQSLVKKLQDYITENFYNCTDEILAGLGEMYVCDERFRRNIDKHKEGSASFVSHAVKAYCKG